MIMNKEDLDFLNSKNGEKFSEAKLTISSKSIDAKDDVINAIKGFSPSAGWVSYQSSSAEWIKSDGFEFKHENIIAGEFYNSDGISLSVRFNGEVWNFFTYAESDTGELLIKKTVKQLSKISDDTYLTYDVYYRFNSELGYRPYCSVFTGFSEEKK